MAAMINKVHRIYVERKKNICIFYFLFFIYFLFFFLRGRFPYLPWVFLHYYTMFLQRIRIIVGDAGFEPGTGFEPLIAVPGEAWWDDRHWYTRLIIVSICRTKQNNNCLVFLIPNNLLKDAGTQTLDAATTALCSAIRLLQSRRRIV